MTFFLTAVSKQHNLLRQTYIIKHEWQGVHRPISTNPRKVKIDPINACQSCLYYSSYMHIKLAQALTIAHIKLAQALTISHMHIKLAQALTVAHMHIKLAQALTIAHMHMHVHDCTCQYRYLPPGHKQLN